MTAEAEPEQQPSTENPEKDGELVNDLEEVVNKARQEQQEQQGQPVQQAQQVQPVQLINMINVIMMLLIRWQVLH